MKPEVFRPRTVEEVLSIVRGASEAGLAIVPHGGGTGQNYGYVPERADILLNLQGLNRILAHEYADLTVTVEAGVTLATLQATLATHNQFLPLDPPYPEQATLGGMLATNAFGPSRLGYGTARDWLIGLKVVDGQGRIIKGGGKVVKNVAGYDLPKLHVGALGTLGVIVEATFKVAPMPEASRTLVFDLTQAASESIAVFLTLIRDHTTPTSAQLFDENGERHLCLVYRGPREVVDSESETAIRLAEVFPPPQVFEETLTVADPEPDETRLRVTVLPGDLWRVYTSLDGQEGITKRRSLPGVGVLDITVEDDVAALALHQRLRAAGLPVCVLAGSLTLRETPDLELWSPVPPAFGLMERLKTALDEKRILNPGRFVGKI